MEGGADCEEVDAKLVHETLQLLSNVTYLRVIIDRISWHTTPKFVIEEARHLRSPRNRGQIYLTYQIPALAKASPRGSNKIFKLVAKAITEDSIIFNEKHVTLCKITSAIIDNWATNDCEIKCFYCPPKKRSGTCFARCTVPMSKVLVLPFSFDSSKVPLNMVPELSSSRGFLKICMQLGSRMQHFLERVEPMRNPTTSVSPLTFLDPTTVRSPRKAEERDVMLISADSHPGRFVVERHDRDQYLKPRFSPKPFDSDRPASDHAAPDSSVSSYRRVDDQLSPRPSRRRLLLNGRPREFEEPEFHKESSRLGSGRIADDRRRHGGVSLANGQLGGFRPEPSIRAGSELYGNHRREQVAHSPPLRHDLDSNFQYARRKPTVAERLKLSVGESINSKPQHPEPAFPAISSGYWLQVTVHQARHLPFVRTKRTGKMHKPSCFVTYRNNERVLASDVVQNSLNPYWCWTTQLFVPADRKNVVFKICHKPPSENGHRSKVVGFVGIELPTLGPNAAATNWYDIMDVARTLIGQIQISLGPPGALTQIDVHLLKQPWVLENGVTWDEDVESAKSPDEFVDRSPQVQEEMLINLDDDGKRSPPGRSRSIPALSPFSSPTAESKMADKDTNTSVFISNVRQEDRCSSFDPFVDLTSRSFLTDKLKSNIDELTELLNRLRRRSTSAHATVPRSRNA